MKQQMRQQFHIAFHFIIIIPDSVLEIKQRDVLPHTGKSWSSGAAGFTVSVRCHPIDKHMVDVWYIEV